MYDFQTFPAASYDATAQKAEQATEVTIRALKGFNADMRCYGGFQYEFGKTYEQASAEVCDHGFHACDGSPFDVWGYFGPVGEDGKLNRFAEVICSGNVSRKDGDSDSKFASTKITIEAEVRLPDFIRRAIAWVIDATKGKGDAPSGHYAKIGSSGHYAKIGSSGHSAQIGSSGHYAQIGSSGHYAKIGSSGDYAQIGSSGDSAKIGSSGHYAKIGSSGHYAQIGSSGDYAQIGSSGDYAQIVAEGRSAVVACAGSATVTAGEGGAICIPYHDGKRTRFAVGYVGEDGIEAGKAYTVVNGKLAA